MDGFLVWGLFFVPGIEALVAVNLLSENKAGQPWLAWCVWSHSLALSEPACDRSEPAVADLPQISPGCSGAWPLSA